VPAVLSAATRIVSFIVPALWLKQQPQFRLVELWYISIASMTVQAVASLWLVRWQLQRRMPDTAAALEAG
jgi:Na+-driven multidrug efflux pump